MKDSRKSRDETDPREQSGMVHVDSYRKNNGTQVESHDRKKPVIKYRLKGTLSDEEETIKGRIDAFDSRGKKAGSIKVNHTERVDPGMSRDLRKLQEELS